MRNWIRHLTVRRLLLAVSLSICGVITYTIATEDPLITAIKKLEKDTDLALTSYATTEAEDKKAEQRAEARKKAMDIELKKLETASKQGKKYIPKEIEKEPASLAELMGGNPDRMRAINGDKIKRLEARFLEVKEYIEKEAADRVNLPFVKGTQGKKETTTVDGKISALMEAMSRYLELQKRLYANLMRNAHGGAAGQEQYFHADHYRHLNLKVSGALGNMISIEDKKRLGMNLRHVRDANLDFEELEMRLTIPELVDQEEQVLRERLAESYDDKVYAKLIHLLTIRQRASNHWAIQRLSGLREVEDPLMNSCGENLVSFGYSSPQMSKEFFEDLKAEDEYLNYSKMIDGGLAEVTFDAPIFDAATDRSIPDEFFKLFDPAVVENSALALGEDDATSFVQKRLKDLRETLNLSKQAEEYWKVQAKPGLLTASFIGDSFAPSEVAARAAWIGFKFRKEGMRKALVKLGTDTFKTGYPDDATAQKKVEEIVDKYLDQKLKPVAADWRFRMERVVSEALRNPERFVNKRVVANQRFEKDIFTPLWPVIEPAARAKNVLKHIEDVKSQKCVSWNSLLDKHAKYSNTSSCLNDLSNGQLAYLNSADYLSQRIHLYTPEQLKSFFQKKYEMWVAHSKEKSYSKMNLQSREVGRRVEKVIADEQVLELMNQFFSIVARDWNNAVAERGADPRKVGPDDTTLAEVLPGAVAAILGKLQETQREMKIVRVPIDSSRALVSVAQHLVEDKDPKTQKPYTTPAALKIELMGIVIRTRIANEASFNGRSIHNGLRLMGVEAQDEMDEIALMGESYTFEQNLRIINALSENKAYASYFNKRETQVQLRLAQLDNQYPILGYSEQANPALAKLAQSSKLYDSRLLFRILTLLYSVGVADEGTLLKNLRDVIASNPAWARKLPPTSKPGLDGVIEIAQRYTGFENFVITQAFRKYPDYANLFTRQSVKTMIEDEQKRLDRIAEKAQDPLGLRTLKNQPARIDNVAPYRKYSIEQQYRFNQQIEAKKSKEKELTGENIDAFAERVRDAFALMNLPWIDLNKVSPNPNLLLKGQYINQRAKTPRQVHLALSMSGKPEPEMGGNLTRSIIDQKLAAEVIYESILTQHPIFYIQVQPGVYNTSPFPWIQAEREAKLPYALEVMAQRYNQGRNDEERKNNARAGLLVAMDAAARNLIHLRPVEDACAAKPFRRGSFGPAEWNNDERWNLLFGSSNAYREQMQEADPRLIPLDQTVARYSRSSWEAIEHDILSPANRILGHLMLIALAIAITGGIGLGALAAGTITRQIVVKGILQGLAAVSGASATNTAAAGAGMALKAIFGNATKSFAFKLVNYLFFAELALSGYATHFTLPAHIRYKLGMANTQIEYVETASVTRRAVADFVEEVHQRRRGFYIMAGVTAVLMGIPVYVKAYQTMKALGYEVRGATGRLAAVEGADGLLPSGALAPTLKDLVKKHGPIGGRFQYVRQTYRSWALFGRIVSLTEKMTPKALYDLVGVQIKRFIRTPEELKELYIIRLKAISADVARLRRAAAKARSAEGPLYRQGTNGLTRSENFKYWISNKIVGNLYHGELYRIAMDKAALRIMEAEGLSAGEAMAKATALGDAEIRALCLEAYADQLDIMIKHFEMPLDLVEQLGVYQNRSNTLGAATGDERSKVLNKLLEADPSEFNEATWLLRKLTELELQIKQGTTAASKIGGKAPVDGLDDALPLDRHLKSFDHDDWARHGKLMGWLVKQADKSFAGKVSSELSTAGKTGKEINQLFKDYRVLIQEIQVIYLRAAAERAKFATPGAATAAEDASKANTAEGMKERAMKTDLFEEAEFEDIPNPPKGDNAELADFEIEVTAKNGKLLWKKVPAKKGKSTDGFRRFWSTAL